MTISGTILFADYGIQNNLDDRHIVSLFGHIAIPAHQVALFVRPDHQQIVRGSPDMLSLYLTGESIPIPEEHRGKGYDYLACQKIWRAPK